jgi:hypothetical protein
VGIDTPEIGEEGYEEAKEFVNGTCLGEALKLDVDDKKQFDPHYRILAVVYVETNLNEKLVKEGYAEAMCIPSEFDPYEWCADHPSIGYLQMDTLNTIIEVAAILFALLGGFVMHYLLSRNETIIERLGLDYHCLRSTLHLFNYKPLYKNPDKSKKILGPILDYLAYICQHWYISAVQGGQLRKNVLEAWPLFANEEKLKEHFLETAKKLDESQGKVRVLPSGLFIFVLVILIVLAGTTLVGLWIKLICEPSFFNPLFFAFYLVLTFFFVLFFAYIYDLERIDTFFVILRPYDFLKWQFIRCLIFADKNNGADGPVKQYLKKAKDAYEDYTNFKYVEEGTRKALLAKAEEVAKQFLEKRKKRHEDREKEFNHEKRERMKEDWEDEVGGMVPWAAIEALRGRFLKTYVAFFAAFFGILICPALIFLYFQSQNQKLFLPEIVIIAVIIIVGLGFLIFLFFRLLGEKKSLPRWWTRGVKIVSFLEDLPGCWDEIIEQNNKEKEMRRLGKQETEIKEEIYTEVKEEIENCIKSYRRVKRKQV